MDKFNISLIQMNVSGSVGDDLSRAAELVFAAKNAGAELCVLPEMFCCPYNNAAFVKNAQPFGGGITNALSAMAGQNGLWLVGGSMPERDGEHIYNTSFVFDPQGRLVARHRKAHLFDINVRGGQRFCESDTFTAGPGPTVFDSPWGKLGVCICFDIRFPKFISEYAALGARALIVPAAFNMTTGPLHWELLFRARAVDNGIYTFGCAPARDVNAGYVSYAHSVACDPWGRVIADAGESESITTLSVDLAEGERRREQIPTE